MTPDPPGGHDLSAPLVLIVDDNADSRELYAFFLEQAGYRTAQAFNGLDALEQLQHGLFPDVLVTDIVMPLLDGTELCQRMKDEPRWRTTPVITMTALPPTAGLVKRAHDVGAAAVLQLPFVPQLLLERIERLRPTTGWPTEDTSAPTER